MTNNYSPTFEEKQIALLEGSIEMFQLRQKQLVQALTEIKAITHTLTEFNPTYEKINTIACKGLEVNV